MKYIGVIDCNNFFVSCERLFRPDLVGKPVLVLSSNDGCVVARSQEIKDMGIPMGVPYFQIKDIVVKSGVICFSSHFTLYRDISARVFSVVRELYPLMEQYSIDEAFFTLEAPDKIAAEAVVRALKETLETRVGIPVSVGLAATKTQAKYASTLAKKAGGVSVLLPADWSGLASGISLQRIWGVGGRLSARYRAAGMETVGDVLLCPRPRIESLFGIAGLRLQAECRGEVMYPVSSTHTAQKSTISSRSFKQSTKDILVVKDAIAYHVRQAAATIRRFGLLAGTLSVTLSPGRHSDFSMRGGTLVIPLSEVTNDSATLIALAMRLVEQLYEPEVPYKKAGITLGAFVPEGYAEQSLFASETKQDGLLDSVIDRLNARYGHESILLGRHSQSEKWQSRQEKLSPAYTTDWSRLATVRA